MTELSSIIERLKGAKGEDRYLDALIMQAITPHLHDAFADHVGFVVGGCHEQPTRAPAFTSSLDAVVALIEEKLPDGHYSVAKIGKSHIHKRKPDKVRMTHEGYVANNENIGAPGHHFAVCDGPSAVLALLIAALSAMKERAE